MAPGSTCTYVDREGKEHNALVIHKWQSSMNVVYVDPGKPDNDIYGLNRIKETSVPFYEPGMSGYYIKPADPPVAKVG